MSDTLRLHHSLEKELREFQMISIQLFKDCKERFETLEDDLRRLQDSVKNLTLEVDAFIWETDRLSEDRASGEAAEGRS